MTFDSNELQKRIWNDLSGDSLFWEAVDESGSVSRETLLGAVTELASLYSQTEETLLFQSTKSWQLAAQVLASFLSGTPFCVIHPKESPDSLKRILAQIPKSRISPYVFSKNQGGKKIVAPKPSSVAYYVLTSGSLGTPKIVPILWKNLQCYLQGFFQAFPELNKEKIAHTFEPGFDMYLSDILLASLTNSTLVPLDPRMALGSLSLVKRIGISVWCSVPSFARMALWDGQDQEADSLKFSFFIGEKLSTDLLSAWRKRAPNSNLVNLYGPAETTMAVCSHRIPPSSPLPLSSNVPIGNPLEGAKLALNLREPNQDIGEIVVSGDFVSPGYLAQQPSNSFRNGSYHTGDLARKNAQGQYEFMGRSRPQMKWKGIRFDQGDLEEAWIKAGGSEPCVFFSARDGSPCLILGLAENPKDLDSIIKNFCSLMPRLGPPQKIFRATPIPLNKNGKFDSILACTKADEGAYEILFSVD